MSIWKKLILGKMPNFQNYKIEKENKNNPSWNFEWVLKCLKVGFGIKSIPNQMIHGMLEKY
jgi:hypothetical protein